MSKYTTQVRYICEYLAGNKVSDNSDYDSIIATAAPLIFKNYPIYDESHRSVLNEKILRHYYTREIAYETAGLWTMKINTKMREIMPYYNELFKSELIQIDPLNEFEWGYTSNSNGSQTSQSNKHDNGTSSDTRNGSVNDSGKRDYTDNIVIENTSSKTGTIDTNTTVENTETSEENSNNTKTYTDTSKSTVKGDMDSTSNSTSNGSNSETTKYSDTPQGSLKDVISGDYLTNVTIKSGSNSQTINETTEQNNNSTNDFTDNSTTTDKGDSNSTTTNNTTTTDKKSNNEEISNSGKHDSTFAETNSNQRLITDSTNKEYSDTSIVNNSGENNRDTTYKTSGFKTPPAQLLKMYRDIILNIDMLIIDELETEFFGLW